MLAAEAAVEGAAVPDLCLELKRERAGFVVSEGVHVGFSITAEERLKPAMLRAAFPHVDDAVFEQYLSVDECFAFRA